MSAEVLTTISPTTNEPIITRNGVSATELEDLPETSLQAFESWRKTPLVDRQIIVKKALKLLGEKKDELANELTVQMGRPISYTGVEITTAVKRGEYLVKISEDTLNDTPGEEEKGFRRFIRKVPVGPVLVIFAWNVSNIYLISLSARSGRLHVYHTRSPCGHLFAILVLLICSVVNIHLFNLGIRCPEMLAASHNGSKRQNIPRFLIRLFSTHT